jgi:GxxExxY protein
LNRETRSVIVSQRKICQLLCGYLADLQADECILVENKTVDAIHPVHRAQLLAYPKSSGCSIGFPIDCKAKRIKAGIQRMIWQKP